MFFLKLSLTLKHIKEFQCNSKTKGVKNIKLCLYVMGGIHNWTILHVQYKYQQTAQMYMNNYHIIRLLHISAHGDHIQRKLICKKCILT